MPISPRRGKPPVRVRPAPEVLADEDMLEMVSAGLVPMTLVEDHIAEFWQQIFPDLVLQSARRRCGPTPQTGMMVRKGSPQLLAELNAFLARYPEGSLTRNVLLQKYLKSVKYAKPATADADMKRLRDVVDLMRKYGDQYDSTTCSWPRRATRSPASTTGAAATSAPSASCRSCRRPAPN